MKSKKTVLTIVLIVLGTLGIFLLAKFLLDNSMEEARQNRRFGHVMEGRGSSESSLNTEAAVPVDVTTTVETSTESTTSANNSEATTSPTTVANAEPDPKEIIYGIKLTDQDGNIRNLSEFAGKHVMVNYWASWCGPCKEEMPELETFYNTHKDDEDFVFLSINSTGGRETKEAADKFIEDGGFTFPYFYDEEVAFVHEMYFNSIPVTFTLFPDGTPGYLHMGLGTLQDFEGLLKDSKEAFEGLNN